LTPTTSAKQGFQQAFIMETDVVKSFTDIAKKAESFHDGEVQSF